MKTLLVCLILAMATPVLAVAQETDNTPGMTNEEARDIARSPEYAEIGHTRSDDGMAAEGELPRTASPLPLLAAMGASALAGALGLRRIRVERQGC